MSGFFALRLASVDPARMRPSGFKILLEILARSRRMRIGEYDFTFAERHSGVSKASWREGLLFLWRLACLRVATVFGRHSARAARIAGFAAVGISGLLVNTAVLWVLVEPVHGPLLLSAGLATQASTLWNFALTDRLVFRGDKRRSTGQRLLGFVVINNAMLLARLPLLGWLVHSLGVRYLLANAITLLAVFVARYVLSDRFLFTSGGPMTTLEERPTTRTVRTGDDDRPRTRTGPVDLVVDLRPGATPPLCQQPVAQPYCYDIHGIVSIRSAVRLKELDHFQGEVGERVDIDIVPGYFAEGHVRPRTSVVQFAMLPAVSYREHLGRRGSDVHIDMAEGVRITAGPMLVRSPHVLYTNVVEALLRFVLVSRGYMLLHSACLDFDGHGVLLSALTDTGKTGTVLRLLREHGGKFLSDDMTIIDATGNALCYPKPLTISQHTLRAVNAGDLTRPEWRRLRVQSRIHSKGGRGIGARLGEMNVPIMSLNALTQFIVPPPKYTVQRLVPCEMATTVPIDSLFVIERNENSIAEIDPEQLIDELISNTDDAYGFPPFRYLAPAFVIGGEGYEELRARERRILVAAMTGVRARRVATPDFSWADRIPELVAEPAVESPARPARAPEPGAGPAHPGHDRARFAAPFSPTARPGCARRRGTGGGRGGGRAGAARRRAPPRRSRLS